MNIFATEHLTNDIDYLLDNIFQSLYFKEKLYISYIPKTIQENYKKSLKRIKKTSKNILVVNPHVNRKDLLELSDIIRPEIVFYIGDERNTCQYNKKLLEEKSYIQKIFHQYNHQNYWNNKTFFQIPLGIFHKNFFREKPLDFLDNKVYDWAFIGELKHDRCQIIEQFNEVFGLHFLHIDITQWDNLHGMAVPPSSIFDVYKKTFFVLIGRGNTSLDCVRIYEAIVAGALPVVIGSSNEIELTFFYNGKSPFLVSAETIEQAIGKCQYYLQNKFDYVQHVEYNFEWWFQLHFTIIKTIGGSFSELSNTIRSDNTSQMSQHTKKSEKSRKFISTNESQTIQLTTNSLRSANDKFTTSKHLNIFCFWEGEKSRFVEKCKKRLFQKKGNANLYLWNESHFQINKHEKVLQKNLRLKSDIVRLFLLQNYGGLWIDSSLIVMTNIEHWITQQLQTVKSDTLSSDIEQDILLGYTSHNTILENWLLYASKNCEFVQLWKDEMEIALDTGIDVYCQQYKEYCQEKYPSLWVFLPYLLMHLCFCVVRDTKCYKTKIITFDSKEGPFYLDTLTKWNDEKTCEFLMKHKKHFYNDSPFLKIVTSVRSEIDKKKTFEFHNHSILGELYAKK
jgi:hypothetical protein